GGLDEAGRLGLADRVAAALGAAGAVAGAGVDVVVEVLAARMIDRALKHAGLRGAAVEAVDVAVASGVRETVVDLVGAGALLGVGVEALPAGLRLERRAVDVRLDERGEHRRGAHAHPEP